jgi:hypothetical protein
MNAKEAGEKFLAELLAQVPADQQAAAREALAPTIETLGAATLRQSDYSRAMDEVRQAQERTEAWKQELDGWYAQNQARLTADPTPTPSPSPIQSPANGLTREDLTKELHRELAIREQAAIAAIVHTNELSGRHYATFKEPLNIQALMADPDISKLGLPGVYDKHYKTKYDELAKKAEDARIEAEVQKRMTAARSTHMPYPTGPREPSPLDALEQAITNPADPTKPVTAPVGSQHVIDAAVAQYETALARSYGQPTV